MGGSNLVVGLLMVVVHLMVVDLPMLVARGFLVLGPCATVVRQLY